MEMIEISPADLVIGPNIRTMTDDDLSDEFVESVRNHGVRQPIEVIRTGDTWTVLTGQRRTRAAKQVGLEKIPAIVRDDSDDANRVVTQWVENEHRQQMGVLDKAQAVEQLALIGVSNTTIGKQLGLTRKEVKVARTVGTGSDEQHAWLADQYDGGDLLAVAAAAPYLDNPEARATFERCHLQDWPAVARDLERDQQVASAVEAKKEELRKAGIHVLDARPGEEDKAELLLYMRTSEDKAIDKEDHQKNCPGHAVYVRGFIPWDDPESVTIEITDCCLDGKKYGHITDPWRSGSPARSEDLTDEEREQRKLKRRHVIVSNKLWAAATDLRREWLRNTFSGLRTPPTKGAEVWLTRDVLRGKQMTWTSRQIFEDLVGKTEAEVAGATPKRALVIGLLASFAHWETDVVKDHWRKRDDRTREVLALMAECGHQLTTIEERMIAGTSADETKPYEVPAE